SPLSLHAALPISDRDAGRDVPRWLGDRLRGRPATRPSAVRQVQAGVHAGARPADRGGVHRVPDPGPGRVLPAVRGPGVLENRLPRTGRPVRGHADDRGDRAADRRTRVLRDREARGGRTRHVHAPRRRVAQGLRGPDLHRRDRKGGEVISSDGQEAEVQIPIPELLEAMLERGASDLHITVGTPPTIRQYGDLVRLDEYPVLDARGIQGMIYAILPQKMRERLERGLEGGMSDELPGGARVRAK